MDKNGKQPRLSKLPGISPTKWRKEPGEEVEHSTLGKVWFTRHALQRMKQRRVAKDEIYSILANPTRKGLRTQPGRFRWRKRRSKTFVVDVVFEKWPNKICIVTVMVLRDSQ
jgi:hypothetical protein